MTKEGLYYLNMNQHFPFNGTLIQCICELFPICAPHLIDEHGSVQDEMVVSPTGSGSPRIIKAKLQADQRSHDDLEYQQPPCVPPARPINDVAYAPDDGQKELLGESVPDSEGSSAQDTKFVTATKAVEQLPPVCHTPSTAHKDITYRETSRTIHHPESEGI